MTRWPRESAASSRTVRPGTVGVVVRGPRRPVPGVVTAGPVAVAADAVSVGMRITDVRPATTIVAPRSTRADMKRNPPVLGRGTGPAAHRRPPRPWGEDHYDRTFIERTDPGRMDGPPGATNGPNAR